MWFGEAGQILQDCVLIQRTEKHMPSSIEYETFLMLDSCFPRNDSPSCRNSSEVSNSHYGDHAWAAPLHNLQLHSMYTHLQLQINTFAHFA